MFWKKEYKSIKVTPDEFVKELSHYKEQAQVLVDTREFVWQEALTQLQIIFEMKNKWEEIEQEPESIEIISSFLTQLATQSNKLAALYHLMNLFEMSHVEQWCQVKNELYRIAKKTKEMLDEIEKINKEK